MKDNELNKKAENIANMGEDSALCLKEPPEIGKAILFSVICFLAFYLSFLLLSLIFSLLSRLLMMIPIVAFLFAFIVKSFTGDWFSIVYLFIILSYLLVKYIITSLKAGTSTKKLTFRISGSLIGIFALAGIIMSFVIGKDQKDSIISSLLIIIIGIVLIVKDNWS